MTQFRDLDEFLTEDNEPIRLPIKSVVYEFPRAISARSGLLIQRMAAAADKARRAGDGVIPPDRLTDELLSDGEETDLRAEMIPEDVELALARSGLTTAHTRVVFLTLLVWHMLGEDAALAVWESGGKAPQPNRQSRRAAATSTRRRASTSGTTSARTPAKATRSGGRTSLTAGR